MEPVSVNIDDMVTKMGDGNLSALIQQTPYANGSEAQLNEGAALAMANDPGPGGIALQAGNVYQPGQVQQAPGVAPSQPVQQAPDQSAAMRAEMQRLQQVAFESARAKIEAEERAFQAEIADLPEHEQRIALAERQLEQTTQVNQWLNQERLSQRQQAQAQQEDLARRQFGFIVAHEAGLPFNNEAVRTALLSARNGDHMRQIARELVTAMNGGHVQQVRQQANQGVFAAGGNNGASAPAQGPKQYSGDLDGLVAARNYQTVNWG